MGKRDLSSGIPAFSSAAHCVTQTQENLNPSKYFELFQGYILLNLIEWLCASPANKNV